MEKTAPIQQLLLRSRHLPLLGIGLTLLILAGTILVARQQLRGTIREQILSRDGEALHAVAQMYFDEDLDGTTAPDVGRQLTVVLKTSRLSGVLGARLFDAQGRFVEAFDSDVLEADLNPADLPMLQQLQPVSHFQGAVRLSENFWLADKKDANPLAPLLEVNVPLHSRKSQHLVAVAQFLIEGHSIAAEFSRLDRHLTFEALAAFGVSGAALVFALGWSFRRLRRTQDMLVERTGKLLQANQELALAAKTSAVGAVSAHLIHGLKNPLSGLQHFVSQRGASDFERMGEEWEQAIASTRRMQAMINEIVNVLREEESGARYELTLAELADLITARVHSLACASGVTFTIRRDAEAVLPNRAANLVALILVNLVQNALQATPAGKSVTILFTEGASHLACEVRDEGSGLPDQLKKGLFVPCSSTKDGGSGIGLAISKQLANHLGAVLELKSSTDRGCVFSLRLPLDLCSGKIPMADPTRR